MEDEPDQLFDRHGQSVTLTSWEREQFTELTRSGKSTAAKFIYTRALLLCDAGEYGDFQQRDGGR